MAQPQMERPAELMVWRGAPAAPGPREVRRYPTLRAALAAATARAEDPESLPWIVTEDGDVLSPHWIDGHAPRTAARPVRPLPRPAVPLS
ncbi:hypothetical protein [Methylobacterium platani]|uniref:Uncharacterized protein n=2 Tax=Methylobacterium platani TaxID=427683 RepID=A0A179S294_9HYPH|nr:hypothetical protein [Methylobacterium platani]KMO19960.1 hypothetical protein SQ03_06825 [Methylobacterium platani JCM 14648]OAS16603.1 hypothetical protein A5481_27965 [Methylobacterium platani]